MSRHAYRPGDDRPAPRLIVGKPRHRKDPDHRHTFTLVAEFEGRRSGIAQCLTRLADGTICEETETRWAK